MRAAAAGCGAPVATSSRFEPRRARGAVGGAALALAIFAALSAPRQGAAQAPKPPQLADVEVGFGGAYRLGFWTPVVVTLAGGDQRVAGVVELTAVDGDGVPVVYRSSPLQLLPGEQTSTTVYVRLGSPRALGVVLHGESGVVLKAEVEQSSFDGGYYLPSPLPPERRLILSVGPNATLARLRFRDDSGNEAPAEVARIDDPARLPTRAPAYDAVDCIVVRADKLTRYAALPPDASQWAALRSWVEQGGKLVIVAGPDVETLMAPGGPLARLLPVESLGMATLPRTTALENAVRNRRLDLDADSLAELRVLRVRETDGKVELAEGDLPLVVRRAVGLGRVTLATFDLEHRVLADWTPREQLLKQMIENTGLAGSGDGVRGANAYYGYGDLAGQLRAGVDQYDDVQVISFFTLAMLVLGYIALVGPGDYLLVRKLLRRTELTWVTLPAIVVLTTVAAHYLAVWLKGDRLRTHQVDVVDCDASSGVVRGTSYAGIFSPSTTRYDVGWRLPERLLGGAPDDPSVVTTWLGLPGEGLGGMQAGGVGGDWFTDEYHAAGDLSALEGMPIQVWSSKVVTGRYGARTAQPLHGPLERRGERIAGTVRNPFPTALEEAWLFHGSDAYRIGRLAPGETFEIATPLSRGLRSVLNDTRIVEGTKRYQAPRIVATPYDTGSLDVPHILRQMMFFEAAGGAAHTHLANRYQSFLDAGELLELNRAILVAQVDDAAGFGPELTLSVDGAGAQRDRTRRHMVVRLVIPVKQAAP